LEEEAILKIVGVIGGEPFVLGIHLVAIWDM
jgi:hypothetical protein